MDKQNKNRDIEEKVEKELQKKDKRRRQKMKVSGAQVKGILKLIKERKG